MKLAVLPTVALVAGLGILGAEGTKPAQEVLIIGGAMAGNLAPCGCSKPMSGGITRRAAAIRELSVGGTATIVETAPLVRGTGRQDQLKLETACEVLANLNVAAVALGQSEAKGGLGPLNSMVNLLGPKVVQSQVAEIESDTIEPLVFHRGFVIGALDSSDGAVPKWLGMKARSKASAIQELFLAAKDAEVLSVLLFDGPLDAAKELPGVENLDLVVFSNQGPPITRDELVGGCRFLSPGEKGKYVLAVEVKGGNITSVSSYELPDSSREDAFAKRAYARYLSRVVGEKLLEKLPRTKGQQFAGNAKCRSCHAAAAKAWQSSAHAKAMRTLIQKGHSADPDCVSCHVVGLEKTTGFRSVAKTPQLANVGCESCHGAGAAHANAPKKFKLAKAGERSCKACHVPDHSPGFEFLSFWKRIAH